MNKGMKTRIYPTSRKLVGLCGDVAIITLTYMFLTYLIVPSGVHEMYHTLYSGMLPVTIILTVMIFSINGLYTIEYRHFSEVLISLAVGLFLVLILVMALSFVIHEFAYSRVLIIPVQSCNSFCWAFGNGPSSVGNRACIPFAAS